MSTRRIQVHEELRLFSEECAPNGAFIALINQSTNKRVDISGWLLVRRIDSGREYRYTIPDNVRVDIGEELRIYASRGAGGAVSPTNQRGVSTVSRQELVNRELTSWGRCRETCP